MFTVPPKLVHCSSPVDRGTEVQQGSDLPRSSAEPRICTQSPKTGSQSPWLPLRAWRTEGVEKSHCTANTPILQVRRLTLRAGGMCRGVWEKAAPEYRRALLGSGEGTDTDRG